MKDQRPANAGFGFSARNSSITPLRPQNMDSSNKNRRDISTNVRTFLWKLIHNAHKCGNYWMKIPNYEDRGMCQSCNTIESMQHIIFNCEANKCDSTWNVVKVRNISPGHKVLTSPQSWPLGSQDQIPQRHNQEWRHPPPPNRRV